MLCGIVRCSAVLYCVVRFCAVLYRAVPYCVLFSEHECKFNYVGASTRVAEGPDFDQVLSRLPNIST